MRRWTTRKPCLTRFASMAMLAALLCAALPAAAADTPSLTNNTETSSPTPKAKRDPKSQSSQRLGADSKRAKLAPPTHDASAPTTLETKGLRGKASFYSPRFQGRKTASGDIFNNKLFTAASNLFPLGTLVAVKRPDTNLCVVVKINDRMHPKHLTRVIDVSHSAAKYLDMVREGVVKVQVVRIPEGTAPGSTIDCAMGYELEDTCEDCAAHPKQDSPLQFLNR